MSTARSEPARGPLLLCYVTDRKQFAGNGEEQQRRLLAKIAECAAAGVDYIQLREKDLSSRALEALARKALVAIPRGSTTELLINSRTDVALASGAHGVHLPTGDLPASEVRAVWDRTGRSTALIGVSTHSLEQVALAEAHGADFALFGPVFEKDGQRNPQGIDQLRQACGRPYRSGAPMPLLALGGVSLQNAGRCLEAGAAGIAGIRLFQENDVEQIASRLRRMRT